MAYPNPVAEKFTQFYETWICRLEEILIHLLLHELTKQRNGVMSDDQELQQLVSKVTSHISEYYSAKWNAAKEDVFIFFSPTWLNPHEKLNQWMTGFKPCSAFTLLDTLQKNTNEFGIHMTDEQNLKIEEQRKRIKMEEGKLEMAMERRQMDMAGKEKVEVAKLSARDMNEVSQVEQVAVNDVFAGSFKIMKNSDCLRLKAVEGVLDVLNPRQSVLFLALFVGTQVRLRQWEKNQSGGFGGFNEDKWLLLVNST